MRGILAIVTIALVLGFSAGAVCSPQYDTDWQVFFRVFTNADMSLDEHPYTSAFGTFYGAGDCYNSLEGDICATLPPDTSMVYAYSTNGGYDWETSDCYDLIRDYRAPFMGWTKQWIIRLGYTGPSGTGFSPEHVYVMAWNPADRSTTRNSFVPLGGETVKLYAFDGDVKGPELFNFTGPALGTVDDAGTWKSGPVSIDSEYLLEIAVVPEPSSMLAFFTGLASIGGFAIYKRK